MRSQLEPPGLLVLLPLVLMCVMTRSEMLCIPLLRPECVTQRLNLARRLKCAMRIQPKERGAQRGLLPILLFHRYLPGTSCLPDLTSPPEIVWPCSFFPTSQRETWWQRFQRIPCGTSGPLLCRRSKQNPVRWSSSGLVLSSPHFPSRFTAADVHSLPS